MRRTATRLAILLACACAYAGSCAGSNPSPRSVELAPERTPAPEPEPAVASAAEPDSVRPDPVEGQGEPEVTLVSTEAAAPPTAVARELASPRNDVPGVTNLARVHEGLFRCAQPERVGFAELRKLGVKTVVNLRTFHSDRDDLEGLGLRYYHIPCQAWNPEDEDLVRFLKVAIDPENQPVLVHCQHGADRTGVMVATYRVFVEGWTKDEALEELPRFGFHEEWANLRKYFHALDFEKLRAAVEAAPAPQVDVVD